MGRLTEARRRELIEADRLYHPCTYGVHVCGDRDGAAATFGNIPCRNSAEAKRVWQACRDEAEARGDEPHDFVVDLNDGPNNLHVDDFWLSRQMLERCLAAGRTALASNTAREGGRDDRN